MSQHTSPIHLIVGLGNPGAAYFRTRHNVGEQILREMVSDLGATFTVSKKCQGEIAQFPVAGQNGYALFPHTYMNASGRSVQSVLRFYKIAPAEMLVIHDDLDLPCGTARLKKGGGHGGHNGLRDIIAACNTADFVRLRIGIDRPPANREQVIDYVLHSPTETQQKQIAESFLAARAILPKVLSGDLAAAMKTLHTK